MKIVGLQWHELMVRRVLHFSAFIMGMKKLIKQDTWAARRFNNKMRCIDYYFVNIEKQQI